MSPTQANIVIFAEPSKHINMLSEALTSGGHIVSIIDDPKEIARLLDTEPWDILIAEIGRSQGALAESLDTIRNAHPDLPVICISDPAEPDRDLLQQTLVITKPYRINHIEECINQLLQSTLSSGPGSSEETILVVDDDELFRTVLVRSLRLFGHSARQARDGDEALDIIEDEKISAVIADIYMPGIDGVTLLSRIKDRWPHMPVILITGYHASDEWPRGSGVSPDGFLMKPFRIEHIKSLLETVTRRKTRC